MSKLVDERVVEMSFDNKKFEENVGETLGTLDKLKQALKFDGVEDSFSEIQAAADDVDFSDLSEGVGSVGEHFSALDTIAFGVFNRLGQMVADKAMQIVGSVSQMVTSVTTDLGTLNNLGSGWQKYDQYNQAVQSLVNSTGMDVDEIEGYLSKLMWYADETSFSFTEMVNALSQASLVGADLGNATDMIIGIANATAYAGKEGVAFQSTVRNLMQSYGSGALTYLDYKSLINQGTATKELQDQIIKAAEELGTIQVGEIDSTNFTEKLKDDWATQEVMELAFSRFGEYTEMAYRMVEEGVAETATEAYELLENTNHGLEDFQVRAAKSGQEAISFGQAVEATAEAVGSKIMQVFKDIFGNYEEAKVLWTALSEFLYNLHAAKYDNLIDILDLWHDGIDGAKSGFSFFWEALSKIAEGIGTVAETISEAWEEIFPKKDAEEVAHSLYMMSWRFNVFAENVKRFLQDEDRLEKISSIVKGVASVFSILKTTASAVFKIISSVVGAIMKGFGGKAAGGAFDSILTVLASVGDAITWVAEKYAEIVEAFINGTAFQSALSWIADKVGYIRDIIGGFIASIWPTVKNILTTVGKGALYAVGGVLLGIGKALQFVYEKLTLVWYAFRDFLDHLSGLWRFSEEGREGLVDEMVDLGWLSKFDVALIEIFRKVRAVWQMMKELWESVSGFFVSMYESISEAIPGIVEKFQQLFSSKADEWGNGVSSGFTSAKDALLAFWEVIKGAGAKVKEQLLELWEGIKQAFLANIDTSKFEKITEAFKTFWEALKGGMDSEAAGESGIIKFLKEIWEFLKVAIPAIVGLVTQLADVLVSGISEAFADGSIQETFQGINAGLGAGLLMQLIGLFKNLKSATDFGSDRNPFSSILEALKEFKENVTDVDKIKAIGMVILELAGSLLLLSLVDSAKLTIAMSAMIGILQQIKVLLLLAQGDKLAAFQGAASSIQKIALGVAAIGAALALLTALVAKDGVGPLLLAVGAITIILAELGAFVVILGALTKKDKIGDLPDMGSEILLIAAAVLVLAIALKKIGDVENPIAGAAAIGILLVAIGAFIAGIAAIQKFIGGVSGMVQIGIGLVFVAESLLILVGVMKLLEFIDAAKIQDSMIILLTAFGAIGLALALVSATGGWNALGAAVAINLVVGAIASLVAIVLLLVAAIKKFGATNIIYVAAGILAFVAALGGLMAILSLIAPALLMVGAAFALLGIGLYAFIAACLLLVPAMMAIVLAADVLLAGIEVLGAVIVQLIVSIIGGLLIGLRDLTTLLVDVVISILNDLLIRTLDWLIEQLPIIIEKLVMVILVFLKGLNDSLEAHMDELAYEIGRIVALVIEIILVAIWDALKKLWEDSGIGTWLADTWQKIKDWWQEHVSGPIKEAFENIKETWDEKVKEPLEEAWSKIQESVQTYIVEPIEKAWNWLKEKIFDPVADKLTSASTTIGGFFDGIFQTVTGWFESVKQGLTEWWGNVTGTFHDLMDDVDGVLSGDLDFKEVAKEWLNKLWEGALNAVHLVLDFFDSMMQGIMNKFGLLDLYNKAKEVLQGFIDGIVAFAEDTYQAVANWVNGVISTVTSLFDSHSPSRVMMEIGKYVDQGFAIGIEDGTSDVISAAEDLGEGTLSTIKSAMDSVAEIMESEDEYSPTITPVYDLSALYSGKEEINSLLDTDPTAFQFKMGDEEGLQEAAEEINSANTSVADAVDDMYTKLSDFMTKVKGEFGDNTVTLNVYGAEGQDVEELADIVSVRINAALQRERAVYN